MKFSLSTSDQMTKQPYPGLRAFSIEEHQIFYGRERLNDALIEKLKNNKFLAILGGSGSGKSSLARAGLQYGLTKTEQYGKWQSIVFRPEDQPIRNLATALFHLSREGSKQLDQRFIQFTEIELRRSFHGLIDVVKRLKIEGNLLILVDQFEEIFRFKREDNREEAIQFVNLLLNAIRQDEVPIHIMITMRSEFLGDCTDFLGLPEVISNSQFVIPRLSRSQYRQAIIEPAKKHNKDLTNSFVSAVLNDIEDAQDQLPSLQHCLMRIWNLSNGNTEVIDHTHYHNKQRIHDALNYHAQEIFEALKPEQQLLAQRIFRCIVELGAENTGIRRPQTLKEILAVVGEDNREEIIKVLDAYRADGANMLRPFTSEKEILQNDDKIDITHESLMRVWERLKYWITEEANDANLYRRTLDQALKFQEKKAEPLTGLDLKAALDLENKEIVNSHWARRYHPAIPPGADKEGWHEQRYKSFLNYIKISRKRNFRNNVLKSLGVAAGLFVFLLLAFMSRLDAQRNLAERSRAEAVDSERLAIANSILAQKEKQNAIVSEMQANLARDDAEQQKQLALLNEKQALESRQEAEIQKDIAERQAEEAKRQSDIAQRNAAKANQLLEELNLVVSSLRKSQDSTRTATVDKLKAIESSARELMSAGSIYYGFQVSGICFGKRQYSRRRKKNTDRLHFITVFSIGSKIKQIVVLLRKPGKVSSVAMRPSTRREILQLPIKQMILSFFGISEPKKTTQCPLM